MAGTRNNPIDKRFIHFKNYSTFLTEINNELEYVEDKLLYGNIKRSSIVWISDKQLIWTHGKFYPLFDLKGFGDVVLTDDLVLKDDDTLIVALAKLNKRTENIEEKLGDSSFVTLDTEQTISGKKTFSQWVLMENESNEITHRYMGNATWGDATASQMFSIRHGLDFKWYDSHWVIGNIRSGSIYTYGFGIGQLTSDGKLAPGLRVTTDGIHANAFYKFGGTSSQFLKADGSVDENNYIKCYDGNVKLE